MYLKRARDGGIEKYLVSDDGVEKLDCVSEGSKRELY